VRRAALVAAPTIWSWLVGVRLPGRPGPTNPRRITVPDDDPCDTCNGSGEAIRENSIDPNLVEVGKCGDCGGTGRV
jgi:hypothetical protein